MAYIVIENQETPVPLAICSSQVQALQYAKGIIKKKWSDMDPFHDNIDNIKRSTLRIYKTAMDCTIDFTDKAAFIPTDCLDELDESYKAYMKEWPEALEKMRKKRGTLIGKTFSWHNSFK